MPKWKTVRIRQKLVEEAKKEVDRSEYYKSLSDFVSEAIRLRMQKLTKERIPEYLERDRKSRVIYRRHPLFHTPKHIWAQATPQGNVRIGITDYFQGQLDMRAQEIVNIQTDKAGEKVSKDGSFGVIETWWFTYDLYSPLNGKIVSVNNKIMDNPFTLNVDPYHWIVEIQPEDTEVESWMDGLLSLEEYNELVAKPGDQIILR